MWRPKNWESIKQPYTKPNDTVFHVGFEAGADAVLQALKDSGEYVDGSKTPYGYVFNSIATYPKTFKGWFVLIPDKEEQHGTNK